jgi:hypothetical protein
MIRRFLWLIYLSVGSSSKTVSMLQMKSKLKVVNQVSVVVAYLGFNANLKLSGFEMEFIMNGARAEHVLGCRLAATTIISMVNPEVVTKLPQCKKVYDGYGIVKTTYP